MDPKEVKRFEKLYQRHLRMLKLQGKSKSTRDAYAGAIRRLRNHFDCSPDKITLKQFESYFAQLVDTHSWSTVKVDCWGIKFFWQFVLEKEWQWVNIVKPPEIRPLPDILTPSELERRTVESGEVAVSCPHCSHIEWKPLSCGNCNCPKLVLKDFFRLDFLSEKEYEKVMEMIDDRNLLSHIYNRRQFEEIYNRAVSRLPIFKKVLDCLR